MIQENEKGQKMKKNLTWKGNLQFAIIYWCIYYVCTSAKNKYNIKKIKV